jgi:hypothetical protein
MRHFVKVTAPFVLSASAALAGCVAPGDDPETEGQADEAAGADSAAILGDCASSATPPVYTAPTYPAPTYTGPTYGAPRYTAPVYQAPCYSPPSYATPWSQASSDFSGYQGSGYASPGCGSSGDAAPYYQGPTYQGPTYMPPITINVYVMLPGGGGPALGGGCAPGGQPRDP